MNRRNFLTTIVALAVAPKLTPKLTEKAAPKTMLYYWEYLPSPVKRMRYTDIPYYYGNKNRVLQLLEEKMEATRKEMMRNVNRNISL